MILRNLDNPIRIRNQLRRLQRQEPFYCYTWDFETKKVFGLHKEDYVASLCEVQMTGLVKRCECWVQKRFSFKNDKESDTQVVVRMESYGNCKRDRMSQSINPLAYAFDKILVDYVYLFLESEDISREKILTQIQKSIHNARFYDANRKIAMLSKVFNEDPQSPRIQEFLTQIEEKKHEIEMHHSAYFEKDEFQKKGILSQTIKGQSDSEPIIKQSEEIQDSPEAFEDIEDSPVASGEFEESPVIQLEKKIEEIVPRLGSHSDSPFLSHDYAKARTFSSPKTSLASPHKCFGSPQSTLDMMDNPQNGGWISPLKLPARASASTSPFNEDGEEAGISSRPQKDKMIDQQQPKQLL